MYEAFHQSLQGRSSLRADVKLSTLKPQRKTVSECIDNAPVLSAEQWAFVLMYLPDDALQLNRYYDAVTSCYRAGVGHDVLPHYRPRTPVWPRVQSRSRCLLV